MNTNMIFGIIVELGSFAIIFIGFIIAVVFFIMARTESDTLRKKKLDKRAVWFFIGPILLVILTRVVYGIYNNANSMNNQGTSTISCDLVMPPNSTIVWHKYCDKNFGFYYPDGWNVEYAGLIRLLVITSPVITNYPGYQGKQVEYVIPYGVQSEGGLMTLQKNGFVLVDASGKVLGPVNSDPSITQVRPESMLGNAVISSFKQFQ